MKIKKQFVDSMVTNPSHTVATQPATSQVTTSLSYIFCFINFSFDQSESIIFIFKSSSPKVSQLTRTGSPTTGVRLVPLIKKSVTVNSTAACVLDHENRIAYKRPFVVGCYKHAIWNGFMARRREFNVNNYSSKSVPVVLPPATVPLLPTASW